MFFIISKFGLKKCKKAVPFPIKYGILQAGLKKGSTEIEFITGDNDESIRE